MCTIDWNIIGSVIITVALFAMVTYLRMKGKL